MKKMTEGSSLMQWHDEQLKVKEDFKRRLKPSGLANPHSKPLNKKSARQSPRLHAVSPHRSPMREQSPINMMMAAQPQKLADLSPNGNMLIDKLVEGLDQQATKTSSGWNNPDLSTLKNPRGREETASGEIDLSFKAQHHRRHRTKNESSLVGNHCTCGNPTGDDGVPCHQAPVVQLAPNSIQIQLRKKAAAGMQPILPNAAYSCGSNLRTSQNPMRQSRVTQVTTKVETERIGDHSSMRDTLNGYFDTSRQIHQLGGGLAEDEDVALGDAQGPLSPQDINLFDLAEKYLNSNKQLQAQQLVRQRAFEKQIMQKHGNNKAIRGGTSRLSNSPLPEDLALAGGRITTDSRGSGRIIDAIGNQTLPQTQDGIVSTSYCKTQEDDKSYKNARSLGTADRRSTREGHHPASDKPSTTLPNMRQIVVQKKKESRQLATSITKRTLIRSLQEQMQGVGGAGIVYQDQVDNLTVSKDILYDDLPTQEPQSVYGDNGLTAAQTHYPFMPASKRREANQKYQALKDLLKSQLPSFNEQLHGSIQGSALSTYRAAPPSHSNAMANYSTYQNHSYDNRQPFQENKVRLMPYTKTSVSTPSQHLPGTQAIGHRGGKKNRISKRNHAYSSVRNSHHISTAEARAVNSDLPSLPQAYGGGADLDGIAAVPEEESPDLQTRKKQVSLQNRLATARGGMGMTKGSLHEEVQKAAQEQMMMMFGAMKSNGGGIMPGGGRNIRTNQAISRGPNATVATAGDPTKLADFISLQEDGTSQRFPPATTTQASPETTSYGLRTKKIQESGSHNSKKVFERDHIGSFKKADPTRNALQTLTASSDLSLAPVLALEVTLKNRINRQRRYEQQQRASMCRHPNESLFRGIMPITDSNPQMGVTVNTNLKTERLVTDKESKATSFVQDAELGTTYLNSFMGRYARQSPSKIRDAEKAFRAKHASCSHRKPNEISPLRQSNRGSVQKQSNQDGGPILDLKAQGAAYSNKAKGSHKTHNKALRNSKITSGSITLTDRVSPQTKLTGLKSRLVKQPKNPSPMAVIGHEANHTTYPLGSKWFKAGAAHQSTLQKGTKSRSCLDAGGQQSDRNTNTPGKGFLRETRDEKVKVQQQQEREAAAVLLNQPSQEVVIQARKGGRDSARLSDLSASKSPSRQNVQEWRQVPIKHHDSSLWPKRGHQASHLPAATSSTYSSRAQNLLRTSQNQPSAASRQCHQTSNNSFSPQKRHLSTLVAASSQWSTRDQELENRKAIIRAAYSQAQSQLRQASNTSIQFQQKTQTMSTYRPDQAMNHRKHQDSSLDAARQSLTYFNTVNSRAPPAHTVTSQQARQSTSPTHASKSLYAAAHRQPNQTQNGSGKTNWTRKKRAVGGSMTNRVGSLYRGVPTQRLARLDGGVKMKGQDPDGNDNKHRLSSSQTNSQVVMVGASQEQMQSRWQDFESRQQEVHFDEAQLVMQIQQLKTNASNSSSGHRDTFENDNDDDFGRKSDDIEMLVRASPSDKSYGTLPVVPSHAFNSSKPNTKGGRPGRGRYHKLSVGKAGMGAISRSKHDSTVHFDIELIVESTPNPTKMLISDANEFDPQTLRKNRDRDDSSDGDSSMPQTRDQKKSQERSDLAKKGSTYIEPGTALIQEGHESTGDLVASKEPDQQTIATVGQNVLDKVSSASVMAQLAQRKNYPSKKETLKLYDDSLSDYLKYQKPHIALVAINRAKNLQNQGQADSPMPPKSIATGGRQISLTKHQSPINLDLFSVIQQPPQEGSKATDRSDKHSSRLKQR